MSTEFLAAAQAVADINTLKNIAANSRQDGMIKYVELIDDTNANIAGTLPEFRHLDAVYRYDSGSTFSELGPAIYKPADLAGAYVAITPRVVYQTIAPAAAPELESVDYYALLSSPTRLVKWRSPDVFPLTPALTDWVGDTEPVGMTDPTGTLNISANAFPTFTPDYVGQRVRVTDITDRVIIYEAFSIGPDVWILDVEDFTKIPTTNLLGGDIPGDFTIALTDHLQFRDLTASANITLPTGLTKNIRVKIAHFEAVAGAATTVTFTPGASTTLNGGVIAIPGSNSIFELYNYGNDWYVK